MVRLKLHIAKPEHEVAYQEITQLLAKNAEALTPLELLAIAANMVGKMIALQDQRVTTPDMVMEIVSANIERGNQAVIEELMKAQGGVA